MQTPLRNNKLHFHEDLWQQHKDLCWIQMLVQERNGPRVLYLSLPLSPRQLHLFQHLRPLLHHQSLLIGEGWDVIIMLHRGGTKSWSYSVKQSFNTRTQCSDTVSNKVSPSPLLQPPRSVASDKETSGDLSSFGCCCRPSGPRWRCASYISSTPRGG